MSICCHFIKCQFKEKTKDFSKVTIKNREKFETFEHIDLEILCNNKVIKLIIIYRPPAINGKKMEKEFIEEFDNYLDTIEDLKRTFICGDFNLWMDSANNKYTCEFNEILDQHDLINSVNKPTTNSEHIIDLVIHHKEEKMVKDVEVEPDCKI